MERSFGRSLRLIKGSIIIGGISWGPAAIVKIFSSWSRIASNFSVSNNFIVCCLGLFCNQRGCFLCLLLFFCPLHANGTVVGILLLCLLVDNKQEGSGPFRLLVLFCYFLEKDKKSICIC